MEPTVFDSLVTCGKGRLKPQIINNRTNENVHTERPVWKQDPVEEKRTKTSLGDTYDGWDVCHRPENWEYYNDRTTAPQDEKVCVFFTDQGLGSYVVYKMIPSADDPDATKLL